MKLRVNKIHSLPLDDENPTGCAWLQTKEGLFENRNRFDKGFVIEFSLKLS